jgi:hypothetical protein
VLRDHGIKVTAIHNHMLSGEPGLFFMRFWANDDAKKLEGLKAAWHKLMSRRVSGKDLTFSARFGRRRWS